MNRNLSLLALILAPLSFALSAQPAHSKLDANQDGAIDRTEAAKAPRLAERFDTLDRNHDGRLTADEHPAHRAGGRHHGGHGGHGGMERLDTDHDGRLSRSEFAAGQALRAQKQAAHDAGPARPPLDFAAIDSNRDGYLVGSELRAYHERMRPQREAQRKAHLEEKFREADLNRDGKLGRLEVDEKLPRLKDRFAWLDENRDGYLSRAELQAAHARH